MRISGNTPTTPTHNEASWSPLQTNWTRVFVLNNNPLFPEGATLDSSLPHLWVMSAQSWWGWLAGVSPLHGPQNPHFCSPSPIPLRGWRIKAKIYHVESGYSLIFRLTWKCALRNQSYRHQTRDGWTFKWPCSLGRCALFRNIYTSSRVFHPLFQSGANHTFLEESLFV